MLLRHCACVDMLLAQAKDSGADRKEEEEEREKAKIEIGIFALYIAQSCSPDS